LMVEIHKKASIPAACLVFVLLGAPLGILAHKGGLGVASGMSLLLFLVYYVLISQGEILADREILTPALSMWLPNALMGGLGLWLWKYSKNHNRLPGSDKLREMIGKLARRRWDEAGGQNG